MTEMIDPLYAAFDPDTFDSLSICTECAKHTSLRRYIEANGQEGPICGICQYRQRRYVCCDLARKDQLINVLKALVRLHYDEFEYNPHWGADHEPEQLLTVENPILEHASAGGRVRDPEKSSDFLQDLFGQLPYPDPEKGISLYGGHDHDGGRLLQLSLDGSQSATLTEFQTRLARENFYDVEPDVRHLIKNLAGLAVQRVGKGTRLYRARIGVEGRFQDVDATGFRGQVVRQPYSGRSLGVPPPPLASAGRLNRNGVAFLYLASDAATAACEVRPHPGHYVSVGQFEAVKDLEVATFDLDIAPFAQSEGDLALFHFVLSSGKVFASPVTPEEARRYSITQLIADCLRQSGFDGVAFKSSVAPGNNLCMFSPPTFSYVDGSAVVQHVASLAYDMQPAATISAPEAHHLRLP